MYQKYDNIIVMGDLIEISDKRKDNNFLSDLFYYFSLAFSFF